ncbi:MAG: hypothetical protein PHT91_03375 [Candidatus Nanoarchaeia archaeon]|nr:hypothetical protein [Candidatus Nanoarchaeia archaeon]MDD5499890.1 hypothetical protein [Candidatus Nanoarchaeia archaeon]
MSDKKTQVMIIDSIISYLLFAFFILYISKSVTDIMNPFSRIINNEIISKSTESLSLIFHRTAISQKDIAEFCNYSTNEIKSVRASYEIKSLMLPHNDEPINESATGIHFQRTNNELSIIFNTLSAQTIELTVFSNNEPIIENASISEYDYFEKTAHETFSVITIHSNSTNEPTKYSIKINSTALIFIDSQENNDLFVGKNAFSFSCGDLKIVEEKRTISLSAILENKEIIADYEVEAYFE